MKKTKLEWASGWLGPAMAVTGAVGLWGAGCGTGNANNNVPPGQMTERHAGQSDFVSAPPGAQRNTSAGGTDGGVSASADAGAASPGASSDAGRASDNSSSGTDRQVEETDIFRVDGNRLYYLNSYRGLMVFDVTDLDHPQLLGRAPLYGSPVEMLVRNGVAYAIVADWYGADSTGRPFHGSLVRAIDARDTSNIRVTNEVALKGWVQDARVVGDVLYTVSQDWGWDYYYGEGDGTSYQGPSVTVTSINISDPSALRRAGERSWTGYSGIFNVTQNAILFAHALDGSYYGGAQSQSQIDYVDISDPAGSILVRGSITVNGSVQGWGANNGRFNIDYDGRYVRALSERYDYSSGGYYNGNQHLLTTVDASDPDHLTLVSEAQLTDQGWTPAARFDGGRMYLSPYSYSGDGQTTPVEIYDVSNPAQPVLAGETAVDGTVWNFFPAGDRLFALGNGAYHYDPNTGSGSGGGVALRYLDVSDPAHPSVLGTGMVGTDWSWSPASNDFKAFTMDPSRGLVVLPFSGWDYNSQRYNNGVQLFTFDQSTLATAGTARTSGWVERGVLVGNRIVSLSDLALQVIDYANVNSPRVVSEYTLARNVVATRPMGDTVAELDTDWWGNDQTHSNLRVLPTTDPDDEHLTAALSQIRIEGTNARIFHNGTMAYVLTVVPPDRNCQGYACNYVPRVQVVDLTDPRAPRLRGAMNLPVNTGYYSYGWYGYWYGWWDGDQVVQVGGDALALRDPGAYDYQTGTYSDSRLWVLDLSNPDVPALASTTVLQDNSGWWGNLRAVGGTLYATHYDWIDREGEYPVVRYYLDRVDLTDRHHPRMLSRVNVPGVFVGASDDGAQIYTMDYRWDDQSYYAIATFNVLDLDAAGGAAYLRSSVDVRGWVGQVFVREGRAYFSAQDWGNGYYGSNSSVTLHALDLRDPDHLVDRAGTSVQGWGWLLGVEGDRALLSSNSGAGVDVYRLSDDAAPVFESFQRTRGWWPASLTRQGNDVFISTGYWGVQTIHLAQ